MNDFLQTNFNVSQLVTALYVLPDVIKRVHKNRPFYGFAYMCDNMEVIFENGTSLKAEKNSIVFFPKHSNYIVETEKHGGRCYAINFDMYEEIELKEFLFTPKNSQELLKHFQNAERIWRTRAMGYYEKSCSELYTILFKLKQELSKEYMPQDKSSKILPAVKFINENYTSENISIAYLASLCGISEVYFRKIFRNVYGTPPLQYINFLKLTHAKELIISGECSVHKAAELSGFFDDSYFSREFKKEFGISPSRISAE